MLQRLLSYLKSDRGIETAISNKRSEREKAQLALERAKGLIGKRFNPMYAATKPVLAIAPNIQEITEILEKHYDALTQETLFHHGDMQYLLTSTNVELLYTTADGHYITQDYFARFHAVASKICEYTAGWEKVEYGVRERNYAMLKKSFRCIDSICTALLSLSQQR